MACQPVEVTIERSEMSLPESRVALDRQEDWEEPKGRATGAPRADQVGAGRT